MPATPLTNLGLNFDYALGEDGWKVGMDNNLILIDWMSQPYITVAAKSVSAEPGAPSNGAAYILGPSPSSGDWAAQAEDDLGIFVTGHGWLFLTPLKGYRVHDRADDIWFVFDGSNWVRQRWGSVAVNDQSGDLEPDILTHANTLLFLTSAFDDVNDDINIPDNATQPFTVGTRLLFVNDSSGDVAFTDDAAVTWRGTNITDITNFGVGSLIEIQKTTADEWTITRMDVRGVHNTDVSGFVSDPNIDIHFNRVGDTVTLNIPDFTDTSDNIVTDLVTPLPVFLRPASSHKTNLIRVKDNGAATYSLAIVDVQSTGDIDFFAGLDSDTWTAANAKSVGHNSITYELSG